MCIIVPLFWGPHVACNIAPDANTSEVRMYMNICIWDPHVICALLCHYSEVRMYINVCVWGLLASMHANRQCMRAYVHAQNKTGCLSCVCLRKCMCTVCSRVVVYGGRHTFPHMHTIVDIYGNIHMHMYT